MLNIQKTFFGSNIKNNILSPIVICFVLIPQAVLFSIIAGVSPMVGIYTAIILGIVTAILGGKAGLISGPTAAIAIIIAALGYSVKQHIPEELFQSLVSSNALSAYILQHILIATIFAGIIQLLVGIFKWGKYIRLIPLYMIFGFVNGLAILIITTQFYLLKGESFIMYGMILLTLLILYYFPRFIKQIPATLAALVIITFISYAFNLDTKKIGDMVHLSTHMPYFFIPNINLSMSSIILIAPYAILIAFVGLLQSLITLCMMDEMSEKRGSDNQECIAQGAGNIACGFFGAMAGSTMLGQTLINFKNGANGRVSAVLVVLFVSFTLVYFSGYITYIPLAVLVGTLFMVVLNLFHWQNINHVKYMYLYEKILLLLITVVTILTELHIAFLISVLVVFAFYSLKKLKIKSNTHMQDENTRIYTLNGSIFFKNTSTFKKLLKPQSDPENVILDFKNARVVDQQALDAIDDIAKNYKEAGINLRIRYLSKDCKKHLNIAKAYCEYCEDEPRYKVAVDF